MDPNANLAESRAIATRILDGGLSDEQTQEEAARLAELVQALDEWISRGGFFPDAWQTKGGAAKKL